MEIKHLTAEWRQFRHYLYASRWFIVLYAVVFFAVYWMWIGDTSPHVDLEEIIVHPGSTYNWLAIGRQGLVFSRLLTGSLWFNPPVATVIGYFFLFASGILFGFIFHRVGKTGYGVSNTVSIFAMISPIMVEQLYFNLQIFEIALAYCICAVAVGLSYYALWHKSVLVGFLSILCMLWVFSSYQIFVIIYISAVGFSFLLLYQNWSIKGKRRVVESTYGKLLFGHIILFIIGFVLNTIITKLFFSTSSYLSSYIVWGNDSLWSTVRYVFKCVIDAVVGRGIYYTAFYGIFASLTIISAIIGVWGRKDLPMRWLYVLASIMLQVLPFVMTVAFGTPPANRTQLAYPFVIASNVVFLLNQQWRVHWKRVLRGAVIVCAVTCLWTQGMVSIRLIYTDRICAQEDARLATELEIEIGKKSSFAKPLAFVGAYTCNLNPACLSGEFIGRSVFNVDNTALPHYFFSSSRICNLMQILGFPYKSVNSEQMLEARQIALDMPCWPEEGSVVDAGDYTIVKLSEDQWPEEVMASQSQTVEAPVTDNVLQYAVDFAAEEEDKLVFRGWVIQPGVSSEELEPTAVLRNKQTGTCIQIATESFTRSDLSNAFEQGELYTNAGYVAIVDLDDLSAPPSEYTLILGVYNRVTGEAHYADTGISLT